MNVGSIGEIDRIFQRVRRLDQAHRAAILAEETVGRPALRAEVESLLAAFDADGASFLDTPALGAGFPLTMTGGSNAVPDRVGQYRVIELLGEGGMATVYVAEQERPRRRVALKLMRTLLGPRAEKRFELEAMVLGRLRHPGIAQIYEAGIHQSATGRIPYIAMELVEGERLTELVKRHSLDLESTLRLFCRICDAVQHAHQQGVVHRDLKPSNILVEDRDGRLSPKLLDLGIARATDVDLQATTFETNVGELVGTVQYMSPEQAAGDPDEIDTRSDVYSLGVVLFELLSGKLPYDLRGKPIHEALRSIREDDPMTLRSADASLRGDLDAIVIKALEKDKARRYQSARDLAEDIHRFMRSEPVTARHPSAAYQFQRFASRNRALVIGSSLVAASLVLGMIGTTIFALRESRARKLAIEAQAAERIQRQQADRDRSLAERRFEDVQDLAMLFVDEVDHRIRGLPGATRAREFIVATGLEYLDRLSQEAGGDHELLIQLAAGYFRLGDVQGFPDTANLGDREGALRSYDKGLALLSRVVELRGHDEQLVEPYSIAYGHYAMVLAELNRNDEAKAFFDKSFEYLSNVNGPPESDAIALIAAYHDNRLGDDALRGDQFDVAQTHFDAALSRYRGVLGHDPDNSIACRGVAAASDRMGRLAAQRGDLESAVEHFERFVEQTAQFIERDGGRVDTSVDLAVGYEQLGLSLRKTARRDEAFGAFEKSLAIRERMRAADPRDRRAKDHLVTSYILLGEESQYRGELAEARRRFGQLIDLCSELWTTDPHDLSNLRSLSTANYKMANVLFQLGMTVGNDDAVRAAMLHDASEHYGRAIDGITSLRAQGGEQATDPFVLIQFASELAACREAIAKIEARTVAAKQP